MVINWAYQGHIIKFHMKANGRMWMKTDTNELGHMTKMIVVRIYGKFF